MVEFVAYFGCNDNSGHSGENILVVRPPRAFQASTEAEKAPYRLMRIAFKGCISARMCPAYSDTEVVDESAFDWSKISGRWTAGDDIFAYLSRQRALWHETGICPDPQAYEVALSPWAASFRSQYDSDQRWKHYLILGHDSYVEVIAEGYQIIEGQVLREW